MDGYSPLHLAAEFGQLEVARQLLGRGADPNAVAMNEVRATPLHSAISAGHRDTASLLLANAATGHGVSRLVGDLLTHDEVRDAYISVDFLDKKTEIIRMSEKINEEDPFAMILDLGSNKKPKQIFIEKPEVTPLNAILAELESFADAIMHNTIPPVTISDGYNALDLAYRIIEKMEDAANLAV
jgi:ankyrin repeat protein